MTQDTAPKSANEVLARLRDDHDWRHDPVNLTTTDGIKRAIEAQSHAIQAIADYVDGRATGETDMSGKPIARSSNDKSNGGSPRDGRPGRAGSAHAA
jgi:hypothetical protein